MSICTFLAIPFAQFCHSSIGWNEEAWFVIEQLTAQILKKTLETKWWRMISWVRAILYKSSISIGLYISEDLGRGSQYSEWTCRDLFQSKKSANFEKELSLLCKSHSNGKHPVRARPAHIKHLSSFKWKVDLFRCYSMSGRGCPTHINIYLYLVISP